MPPFRDKLLATLRAVRSILEVPGVLVAGSQIPNLLQPDAASTLVVSQDVDLLIPVTAHQAVKDRLASITDLHPSSDEPSVWIPSTTDLLIEVNFIGKDESILDPIDTYEKALETNPESATVHHFLGVLYELSGDTDRAIERYESAIEYGSGMAEAKNNLAYLYAEQGENLDRALDLAQDAKSLLPDNPSVSDTLGWVLFKRGVPSAAVSYLKEAEQRTSAGDASLRVIRYHLALALEASGEKADALAQRYESVGFEDVHGDVLALLPQPPARALDIGARIGVLLLRRAQALRRVVRPARLRPLAQELVRHAEVEPRLGLALMLRDDAP